MSLATSAATVSPKETPPPPPAGEAFAPSAPRDESKPAANRFLPAQKDLASVEKKDGAKGPNNPFKKGDRAAFETTDENGKKITYTGTVQGTYQDKVLFLFDGPNKDKSILIPASNLRKI
jgi:hypothetical protein